MRALYNFYIDASIHVALALVSLVYVSTVYLNLPYDWRLMTFLFCTTIASYNFIKYGVEAEKYILVSNKYHRIIQLFSFLVLLPAVYLSLGLRMEVWITLFILAALVGFYAIPILPQKRSFRTWGSVKVGIVALVWSGTTVLVPVLQAAATTGHDMWIEASQRFLFVLVMMIPFEIRDLAFDKPNLGTLPQRLGIRRTKKLGYGLIVLCLLLTYFKDSIELWEPLHKAMVFSILMMMVYYSNPQRNPSYSSFWVEGLPIFWAVLIVLF